MHRILRCLTAACGYSSTKDTASAYWEDLNALLRLALPAIVTTMSQQAMVATDQVFVGHLGTTELAAAALGNTFFNVIWFFLLGTTTALDTLGSQAYGGGDHGALLVWSGAMCLFVTVLCAPAALVLSQGSWVGRVVLGQPQAVAHMMGGFCRSLIPGLWPLLWGVVLMKHLQVQNVMHIPAAAALLTFLLNIAGNALLVTTLGFQGAPLATTLSRLAQFCMLACAVHWWERHRRSTQQQLRLVPAGKAGMHGNAQLDARIWSRDETAMKSGAGRGVAECTAFGAATPQTWMLWFRECTSSQTQGRMTRLAIPGGFMLCLEASAFEVTTAMASRLSTVELAAHACQLSIQAFTFVAFPFAISIASTIRVGNMLGANNPDAARRTAWLGLACAGPWMLLCGIITVAARHDIGRIFSSDPAVIAKVAEIAPWGAAMMFADGLYGATQGALRGAGKQVFCLAANVLGFWVLGFISGALLCFRAGWRLKGLWAGIMMGIFATGSLSVGKLMLLNWPLEADRAQQAAASGGDSTAPHKHTRLRGDDYEEEEDAEEGTQLALLQAQPLYVTR